MDGKYNGHLHKQKQKQKDTQLMIDTGEGHNKLDRNPLKLQEKISNSHYSLL